MREGFGDRVRDMRKRLGLSQQALADAAGVSQALITKIESGRAQSSRHLTELAQALGVTATWLKTGEGEASPEARYSSARITDWGTRDEIDDQLHMMVPLLSVEAAAGDGAVADQEVSYYPLPLHRSTLRRLGVTPENAACVRIIGNSMEPRLYDGDIVGIDLGDQRIRDGKAYAIWQEDIGLRVKYLVPLPGGGLRVRSHNREEYPDEDLTREQAKRIQIRGRVFWNSGVGW